MMISNLVRTTRFWNNIHRARSKPKIGKPNNLKVIGSRKTKGPNQNSQSRLWSTMSDEGKR